MSVADRDILRGMVLVFSFALVAALAGAGKEMAVAWRLGVGPTVDAYQLLFALVQWPLGIFASLLTVAIVPLAARIHHSKSHELAEFRAEMVGMALLAVVPLTLVGYLALTLLLESSVLALDSSVQAAAVPMVLPISLLLGFGSLAVLLGGWIMTQGRQVNTLLQALPAICVLMALLLHPSPVSALVWGTAIGFVIYAAASWLALVAKPLDVAGAAAVLYRARSPHWRPLLVAMGTLLFGQILMSLVAILDQFFAARLGVGALSTLGYSNRLVALVLGLAAIAINRAMLPVLSRLSAQDPGQVYPIAIRFALGVAAAGLLMGMLGAWLAEDVVRLLFEHGAFMPQDTERVAELVRYSMVQVPFFLASMVFVSALLSGQQYRAVLWAAAVNGLVKIVVSLALVAKFGLPGLLLATAVVYVVSTLHCWLHLRFGTGLQQR